ncbi:PAS domain-containing protein [Sulfurimonas sp.]|uniref:PAS domain-containing protein n=1 Tax=Sulfurimonas sp. TaxID=2022749 RepID=UPI003D11DA8E
MEVNEKVFETIDGMGYPLLIVENTGEKYNFIYENSALKKLISIEEAQSLPKDLEKLIKHLPLESGSEQISLHNYAIFDAVYTIYATKTGNNLSLIFVELQIQELFKNMTFIDEDSGYNPLVVVLNTQGLLVDANESFLETVQLKREDILQKSFFKTFIPGDLAKLNKHLEAIHSSDSHHQHFITPLKDKEGKLYRIQWQVSTMKKGENVYIVAIGSDVSKFMEENCELKREITSIKAGFEYFPMAIGYMDSKGDFITMNPKFIKMLKIPQTKKHLNFKEIPFFHKNIDFKQMSEYIELIKEMHFNFKEDGKNYRVDIRMLHNSKRNTKLYIFVVQKL